MAHQKLDRKKSFLECFLKNHRPKWASTFRLIQYLLDSEQLLEKIRFVQDLRGARNYLQLSIHARETYPIVLHLNGTTVYTVDQAIERLKESLPQVLYVRLSFEPGCEQCLFEDLTRETKEVQKTPADEPDLALRFLLAVIELSKSSSQVKRELMAQVDQALDKRDREEFRRLAVELKRLSAD